MWNYKGTYKFDIGSGYGELEYDFFTIHGEEDFSGLIDYYRAIWKRFDYFLDRHRITRDNKRLSPMVILAMKTHRANLCLTFRDEIEDILKIRSMVVNREMPNGSYDTIVFDFFRFVADKALSYFKKGQAYQAIGYYNAAITCYTHAIMLDPNVPQLYMYRGNANEGICDYDRAIEDFTQVIKLDPAEAMAYINRGHAYGMKGDYETAFKDLAQAIKMDPNFVSAYITRGIVYETKGDYTSAKTDYTKALELDPDNRTARKMLETLGKKR